MAIKDSTTDISSNAEAPSPTIRSTPCSTNPRCLTVTRLANGKPDLVPQLRIKGLWLSQAAFPIGSKVRILVSPKRLVIELGYESGGYELFVSPASSDFLVRPALAQAARRARLSSRPPA